MVRGDLKNASREEILALRRLVEQYFLGEITPDQFKAFIEMETKKWWKLQRAIGLVK